MAVFLRPSRSVLRIAEGAAAASVVQQARAGRLPQHGVDELAQAAGGAEELERLTKLHTVGALSDAEFGTAKSRLLGF
jgi:hypothetical protein